MFFEEYWWIFPLIMISICFLTMRGKGSMCGCGSHGEHSPDSPKEILDRRYANGEIEKAEYEDKKRDIN